MKLVQPVLRVSPAQLGQLVRQVHAVKLVFVVKLVQLEEQQDTQVPQAQLENTVQRDQPGQQANRGLEVNEVDQDILEKPVNVVQQVRLV